MKTFYAIYHNENQLKIEIITNPHISVENIVDDEVRVWNYNYYYSTSLENIKKRADEIKEEWFQAYIEKAKLCFNLKIGRKFNQKME